MTEVSKLAVIVTPDATIESTVQRMAQLTGTVAHSGIAIVLDREQRVEGVLTDGDIRRAYANKINVSHSLQTIMDSYTI